MSKPPASGHQLIAARVACIWSLSQLTMCTTPFSCIWVHRSLQRPQSWGPWPHLVKQVGSYQLGRMQCCFSVRQEVIVPPTRQMSFLHSLLLQVVTEALSQPLFFTAVMLIKDAGAYGRATYQAEPEEWLGRSLGCL